MERKAKNSSKHITQLWDLSILSYEWWKQLSKTTKPNSPQFLTFKISKIFGKR